MFVKSLQGEKGYQLKEIIPPENYPFTLFHVQICGLLLKNDTQ